MRFSERFKQGKITQETAIEMARWLREDGVEKIVIDTYTQWTEDAFFSLEEMICTTDVRNALIELTNNLLIREK